MKVLLGIFSRYVHPFEKKADKFFRQVKSNSSRGRTQKNLGELMQENLVVLNLWMEKKYKNYVYLKKRVRRRMYEDVEILKTDFLQYAAKFRANTDVIYQQFKNLGVTYPSNDEDKVVYLASIMSYLRPGERYTYQLSANFGKLLKNPLKEKLVGDCNQIVTLYGFLYSLKYPISDLNIKILPGHVCLHFRGIDIEATNGTFKKYTDYEAVLDITELITTNLLDVADEEAKTASISPREMVKRAQLAYLISSKRELVEKNLKIAYQNLGIRLMREQSFTSAIFFFEKLGDRELLKNAYHNATIYFLKSKSFSKAMYYAKHSGEDKLMRACYMSEYRELAQKVRDIKNLADARQHKATYQKMLDLARQGGDEEAAESVRKILGQL